MNFKFRNFQYNSLSNDYTCEDYKYVITSDFLTMDACKYARLLRDEKVTNALRLNISEKTKIFMEQADHRKDKRNSEEFSRSLAIGSLIVNWVQAFNSKALNIECFPFGCDASDTLETDEKITNIPDLYSQNNLIEVVADFYNWWEYDNYIYLRDNKLPNILQLTQFRDIQIFALDVFNSRYQVINIIPYELEYERIESIPWYGNKEGYRVKIDINKFVPISQEQRKKVTDLSIENID